MEWLLSGRLCMPSANAAQQERHTTPALPPYFFVSLRPISDDERMEEKSFQEYYAPEFSHCYGCGVANANGLHIKSYWLDEASMESIAYFRPEAYHTGGFPGNVYGGLIAALLDCHGNGTAAAAGYRHLGREIGSAPHLRYVTANLNLNFLRPTPIGFRLELRAKVTEVTVRRVNMSMSLMADGITTVEGSMVSVLLPDKAFPQTQMKNDTKPAF